MPPTAPRDALRRLRTPAYTFLLVMLVFQFGDFLLSKAPFRFESVVWRFSMFGDASSSVGNFFLLIMLLFALSLMFSDRRMMLFVGVLAGCFALFLFAGTGMFALDALQLRSRVDASGIKKFDIATAQALGKLAIEAVVATMFAIAAFRANSSAKKDYLRDERNFDSPIVSRSSPLRVP